MKVCVVGSGGREHALAHVLARSCDVVVTPGNPGIARSGEAEVTAAPATEVDADLTVIGPEAPLVAGLADELRASGRLVFGPGAEGARLEGSKSWMKQLLVAAGVPTAGHGSFTDVAAALEFLQTMGDLFVVKADGLAAGKGVVVTSQRSEAEEAVRACLSGDAFGEAGRRVVIEEGLTGPELSVLAVCDGRRAVPLAPARDHKRLGDGDLGPNTGGMGAYSPVPDAADDLLETIMADAVEPTLAALVARGVDYRGVLYAGLMLTPDGPKVLEYNVRFGDPEAQAVLPRLRSDLADLLAQAAAGSLETLPEFDDGAAVNVVCAAAGYPTAPRSGDSIVGAEAAASVDGATVFFAGVADGTNGLVTAGGRVLSVTGQGPDLRSAAGRAYEAVACLDWEDMHVRSDIAAAAAATMPTGAVAAAATGSTQEQQENAAC